MILSSPIAQNEAHQFAFIALGSNQGDSGAMVRDAISRLQQLSSGPIHASSLWRSSPVDCPPGSPDFINAVIAFRPHPEETPESLLAKLQELEREFGRKPKLVLNEPRPLDLDLICFRNEIRRGLHLVLPHPRAHQRRFVLQPLAEIAPDLVLLGRAEPVRVLLQTLHSGEVLERL